MSRTLTDGQRAEDQAHEHADEPAGPGPEDEQEGRHKQGLGREPDERRQRQAARSLGGVKANHTRRLASTVVAARPTSTRFGGVAHACRSRADSQSLTALCADVGRVHEFLAPVGLVQPAPPSSATSVPNDIAGGPAASSAALVHAPGAAGSPRGVRTMPCTAATTLRQYRGRTVPRSHGADHDAANVAYRATPMASTHHPVVRATQTLRTRTRNASTSMSKRAPSAEGGSGVPCDPPVDRVEQQCDDGDRHEGRYPRWPGEGVDGQRRDAAGEHRPGQGHVVCRPEAPTAAARQAPHESCPRDHGAREARPPRRDRRSPRSTSTRRAPPAVRPDRSSGAWEPSARCLRFSIGLDPRTRHASPGFIRRRLARVSPCPVLHARSGWSSPPWAKSDRWSCGRQGQVKCWCARCTPASVGEQRPSSSAGGFPPVSMPRCARRTRPATSRGRSSTDTSVSAWSKTGHRTCSAERCSPCSRTRPLTSCPPTRLSWCPMTFLRCAPVGRHGGDRRQRPVGRGATARRPGGGGRRRDGGLLRRPPAGPDSGRARHSRGCRPLQG